VMAGATGSNSISMLSKQISSSDSIPYKGGGRTRSSACYIMVRYEDVVDSFWTAPRFRNFLSFLMM
jgi:hypothetical protein